MKIVSLISILLRLHNALEIIDTSKRLLTCYKIFQLFFPPYIMMKLVIKHDYNENRSSFLHETIIYHLKNVPIDDECRDWRIEDVMKSLFLSSILLSKLFEKMNGI
ncbi:hypothetical protein RF11_07993 [Thelohanellus kitauei]|uniref:Uncharacterized protein n=1 Tax=Thelohanellus kitauei TaxID=669202 RepID=A0A0C2JIP0_THEKT|nr:hypothetical protein RF11_07993 [Thelohanellus kitauei]